MVVTSCLLVAHLQRSAGPRSRGKTLHAWLVILLQSTNLAERVEAEAAVQEIGTNALPTLISWLSHRDSKQERALTSWLAKHGLFAPHRFSEKYYHRKALCGFRVLGTNGQSAVPDLRRFLADRAVASDAELAIVFVSPLEAEKLAEKWIADTNLTVRRRGEEVRRALVLRTNMLSFERARRHAVD